MNLLLAAKAALLGLIEGLTEFLPVSSTGHLILLGHYLGFTSPGHSFEVLIQLGAIAAILSVYAHKLFALLRALPSDKNAQRFAFGVFLAFLPAMVIGGFAHSFIKSVLFSPLVVSIALIVGGVILLVVNEIDFSPRYHDITEIPPLTAFKIGLFQCLAMVPGVSRSGATIVGAMLLGTDKRAAAEFSFFLAMPTMAAAFSYDLYKNHASLTLEDGAAIGIGFVVSFVCALLVVRRLLDYVSARGYALFGWWRIVVGVFGLSAYLIFG